MAKTKKVKKRGYIGKFLKKADDAISTGIKNADKAIQDGIKKADEALDAGIEKGALSASQAKIEAAKLKKQVTLEATKIQKQAMTETTKLKKQGSKQIQAKIDAAKAPSKQETIKLIEKLNRLKKQGIITEKEFQLKKKQLLAKI